MDSAADTGARRITGTYAAEPAQVGHARRALAQALDGHLAADAATLIASELATNAVLHSASGNGGKFSLAVEIHHGYVWVGVGDGGGPWNRTGTAMAGRTGLTWWRPLRGRRTGAWTATWTAGSRGRELSR